MPISPKYRPFRRNIAPFAPFRAKIAHFAETLPLSPHFAQKLPISYYSSTQHGYGLYVVDNTGVSQIGSGLLFGKNSPFSKIPLIGPLLGAIL